jgi:hypothetical protein
VLYIRKKKERKKEKRVISNRSIDVCVHAIRYMGRVNVYI